MTSWTGSNQGRQELQAMVALTVRSKHFSIGTTRTFPLIPLIGIAIWLIVGSPLAMAQSAGPQSWELRMHSQQLAVPTGPETVQIAPRTIPRFAVSADRTGALATFQPGGTTNTSTNPFFQNLGTNGRTCFTCHQGNTGWTVSAASVQQRFADSNGTDPIFRLVDGATCSNDDVSSLTAMRQAYSLLLNKGLIRIAMPLPASSILQFKVTAVNDPYNCTTDPTTGLTSETTGVVSAYRRPLPSTNLGFLSTIMIDGREPSLASQAIDATLGHAQAVSAPTSTQVQEIVDFESGLYTAQQFDNQAAYLDVEGATGGPVALSQQNFFIGINDPFGNNPTGASFSSQIFDIYQAWESLTGSDPVSVARESIARGEELFNNTKINITNVAGINDVTGQAVFHGFCSTCHDTPNVGDHSVKAPLNIGVADPNPPGLDNSDLPVFTVQCIAGPLAGQTFVTTDIGRAMISGKCADIGKFKGPILRGLAARAPYFHNGSATTLMDVVNFYDQRFGIGFTDQQKQDLVNFLNTL
jgi:cytochrome c peroxidase